MTTDAERLVVISTDGHCGAGVLDYKAYLESRFHDEFDEWAAAYRDGWTDIDVQVDPDVRLGFTSFETTLNWDSKRRLELMEEQGVVGEVLFPNTAPPFYPSAAIAAPGPRTAQEYDRRWAGVRAHNRWLADFCAETPGRRAGIAQLFLDDVDDAVAEIRWARDAGLQGVLLPGPHPLKMVNLYYPDYDPVWAVCQELDIPICTHGVLPVESPERTGMGGQLAGYIELPYFGRRQLMHLMVGGVFDRFPDLKLSATELTDASTTASWLAGLDAQIDFFNMYPEQFPFSAAAAQELHRKPSEYFASNIFLGGPLDILESVDAACPNLMFGVDLPHAEGTAPYTDLVLRLVVSRMSEAEQRAFLHERAAHVFGFDVTQLQSVADRVGPLVSEVTAPPEPDDLPRWPHDTRCFALSGIVGIQPEDKPAGAP
jgi:predicted TIM-barrel fold metal-dependent hydrolase